MSEQSMTDGEILDFVLKAKDAVYGPPKPPRMFTIKEAFDLMHDALQSCRETIDWCNSQGRNEHHQCFNEDKVNLAYQAWDSVKDKIQ